MAQPQPKPSPLGRRIRSHAIAAFLASVPVVVAAQSSSPLTSADAEAPTKDPRPFAALSNTAMSMRDSVVFLARAQIGTRYRFGGTTPKGGFDCSGFVRYVLGALQFALPRTAAQQAKVGSRIPIPADNPGQYLQPGDRLYFSASGSRVDHTGLYMGNGLFVHASGSGRRVIVSNLFDSRNWNIFVGARR